MSKEVRSGVVSNLKTWHNDSATSGKATSLPRTQNHPHIAIGKACGWKRPRAPSVRAPFQDDRATPAVLTFFRETKAGRMVSLVPLMDGEREEGNIREEELRRGGWTGPAPRMPPLPRLSLVCI